MSLAVSDMTIKALICEELGLGMFYEQMVKQNILQVSAVRNDRREL